ncbi:hypothetical protein BO86DRAFT_391790 [Aspergillus japonicus CBS 114.51]|uniref:Uncharacterized protein n=1 Tax=Aspergillus japonicus CBS 114.51 TaxID=1448312 RepID=A0A8T8WRP8_ASPJA|nr:hypothetical protein BO86DRAFT_391790 [Aspergillus japonicus CBS 114.51]RAH78373.1 hypothetical protein BO86DRAFT_391790 [Aspergillus japonicus CBS 114.51]
MAAPNAPEPEYHCLPGHFHSLPPRHVSVPSSVAYSTIHETLYLGCTPASRQAQMTPSVTRSGVVFVAYPPSALLRPFPISKFLRF